MSSLHRASLANDVSIAIRRRVYTACLTFTRVTPHSVTTVGCSDTTIYSAAEIRLVVSLTSYSWSPDSRPPLLPVTCCCGRCCVYTKLVTGLLSGTPSALSLSVSVCLCLCLPVLHSLSVSGSVVLSVSFNGLVATNVVVRHLYKDVAHVTYK